MTNSIENCQWKDIVRAYPKINVKEAGPFEKGYNSPGKHFRVTPGITD